MTQTSSTQVRQVCNHCGSDRVIADANAVWDVTQQSWVLAEVFDDYFCSDCEGETSPQEVEVVNG